MSETNRNGWAFGGGIALVAVISLLIVWTTIVRDDGSAAGYFMLILAAGVGSFATRFQPAGMARTMAGVAGMQAALGLLTATAPSTANLDGGPVQVLIFAGVFVLLWLTAAALFYVAGRSIAQPWSSRV
ncbi:hypothetical protein [Brevundimonas lenta]|uniref:Uncharacterized protein n=1 Tax=Brevundimonas lenta TaxID=424796 RepID=A0A7W6JB55_9CAUL|nr:hypothetical protein [Brevundimonas lenta]MBB4081854.1 hypothetical protein [Brevundimonas lenta]